VLTVVCRFPPLTVSNDGCLLTQGAPPRQLVQTDPRHPGTALSSSAGNEIKRITAGVKACRWFSLPGLVRRRAFTSWCNQYPTKKEYCLSWVSSYRCLWIGRYKRTSWAFAVLASDLTSSAKISESLKLCDDTIRL
jgi:hypothetical protein